MVDADRRVSIDRGSATAPQAGRELSLEPVAHRVAPDRMHAAARSANGAISPVDAHQFALADHGSAAIAGDRDLSVVNALRRDEHPWRVSLFRDRQRDFGQERPESLRTISPNLDLLADEWIVLPERHRLDFLGSEDPQRGDVDLLVDRQKGAPDVCPSLNSTVIGPTLPSNRWAAVSTRARLPSIAASVPLPVTSGPGCP